jgi:hypothetical protein
VAEPVQRLVLSSVLLEVKEAVVSEVKVVVE